VSCYSDEVQATNQLSANQPPIEASVAGHTSELTEILR